MILVAWNEPIGSESSIGLLCTKLSKKINSSVNGLDFRAPFVIRHFVIFSVSHSNDLPFFLILWKGSDPLRKDLQNFQSDFLVIYWSIEAWCDFLKI